ncbi:MAG: metallophosphoesterase [Myxococcota bacterium]
MQRALADVWNQKVARLPADGVLLVCTDLHGNLADFERMLELYDAEEALGNRPVLAFCGDLVHGPSKRWVSTWPSHLGTPFVDASAELICRFEEITRERRVFTIMGNHEHSHVGGPVVPKFYPDEAAVLERTLGDRADGIRDFMGTFPLVAVGPCGIVLTHGAPAATLPSAEAFEDLDYAGYDHLPFHSMCGLDVMGTLLWARGCGDSEAVALLMALTGSPDGVVAFGHDIVREGYAVEGPHHICVSTSFGVFDARKRYLRLDLGGRYASTGDLREGHEILHLYP